MADYILNKNYDAPIDIIPAHKESSKHYEPIK
jgi:hypothetical protein